jgi:predicted permease
MRLMLIRTLAISALLSILAVATTTILFTRTLHMGDATALSASTGFAGTLANGPEPPEGFKVLLSLLSEPSFGWPILLPQFATYFIFLWAAAILGSGRWARGSVA